MQDPRGFVRNGRASAARAVRAVRTGSAARAVRAVGAAAALLLAVGAPAALAAQDGRLQRIDETREVARDALVEVEAVVRTVRVSGWDRDEVRVQGAVRPEFEEFTFEAERGSVHIEIEHPDDWRGHRDRDLPDPGPLTVSVPRGGSITVEVVNGSVTVEGVDGTVEIESVNGEVRYAGGARNVEAETVNGRVIVEAPDGRRVDASSVNGDVVLRVGGGFAEAESVSGSIDIRAGGPVEAVSAETVSGNVEFRGRPVAGASLEFETHSGNVVLRLPGDLAARLEATTFSGRIQSAFGGEAEETSRWTPEKSYLHTVGSGDVRITAETFSGDVRFLKEEG